MTSDCLPHQVQTSYAATARRGAASVTCPLCRSPSFSMPAVAMSAPPPSARPSAGPTGWPRKRRLPAAQARERTVLEMPHAPVDPALGTASPHEWHEGWVAALIGRKGLTIQSIQALSGATVTVQRVSDLSTSATTRLIEIKGSPSQREKAEALVRAKLSQVERQVGGDFQTALFVADPLRHLSAERRRHVDQLHALTTAPHLECAKVLEACAGDAEAAAERLLLSTAARGGARELRHHGEVRHEDEEDEELRRAQQESIASAAHETERQRRLEQVWTTHDPLMATECL